MGGREVPTTEEPCDSCGTTFHTRWDFMGDILCDICASGGESHSITIPPTPICSTCKQSGGFLLSEDGTNKVEQPWYCVRCYIETRIEEAVTSVKAFLKEDLGEMWDVPKKAPEEVRRAPVQANMSMDMPAGTIEWWEHEKAWKQYAATYGSDQSAERIAERHGFCYGELVDFLGGQPTTWKPV